MRYCSLHHHSTFSFLDGFGLPEAHVRRAGELEMPALALTEHGNVSSKVKLEMAAKKEGIKPIFGVELYCGDTQEETRTQKKNHLTVLAADQGGYQSLLRVVSQGWSDFYYEPTVSGASLATHRKGLVVLSGCTGSLLATSLIGGKNIEPADSSYERGRQVAARFKKAFGDSYYLEVQAFPELEASRKINVLMAELSIELGVPLIATGDVHYTKPSENEMQQILHNLRGGNKKTLEEQAMAWGYDVPLSPPTTDKVIYDRLRGTGLSKGQAIQAILATEEVAQRCTVELPVLPRLRFPTPHGFKNNMEVWHAWLKQGLEYRGVNKMSMATRRRYHEKLRYELSIIEAKDFIDYFLIVSDIVKFAKDSGIPVGPARGSAAASLVCWLLRITEVDPMLFPNLVFERFIDLTREDLPDIDLDFDSDRRQEIEDYAVSKYGRTCVGNIGTFTYFRSKNSLDDVARVYKIPQYEVDTIKGLLLERSSGDLRASATIQDTVEQFEQAADVMERYPDLARAYDLEGQVKGMGVHAAGLIISNGPLTDVCAIYARKVKGVLRSIISLDKYDAERQNLVKIDVLGLSTMSMIAEALRQLGMPLEELYKIPLNDQNVIDGFARNDVVGIFQFDGRAMRSVNAELQPDSFKEVCDVNALARPGPLHNNASANYIDVKKGNVTPPKLHPIFDAIAEDTHYQIVYQEQILRIVREVGGFDWTHAAYIRKIISKKLGEQEFNRQWERFWEGAKARGLEEDVAKKIWGLCITSGSYAFNAAHCQPGEALVRRPNGGSISLEKLWRATHCFIDHGIGGDRITTEPYDRSGGCLACGSKDAVAGDCGQCRSCAHLRRKFYKTGIMGLSMNDQGQVVPNRITEVFMNGKQKLWRLELSDGTSVRATGDHEFKSLDDWVTMDDLKRGAVIMKMSERVEMVRSHRHGPNASAMKRVKDKVCMKCGARGLIDVAHLDDNPANDSHGNLRLLCRRCHANIGQKITPWSKGRYTEPVVVLSKVRDGSALVYTLEMEGEVGHNYVTDTGFINHNCVSYGMLAWWCMWLKVYHPQVFYVACLQKMGDDHQLEYLRDAMKKGIETLPPHPGLSGRSWLAEGKAIRAGFEQIPGIGDKMSPQIVAERERVDKPPEDFAWSDLLVVKGIGHKKIANMVEFAEMDDPFKIHWLRRRIDKVKAEIKSGDLGALPSPTHTSLEVPYRRGENTNVVWLGILKHRNLRDLFEANFARTGVALDPKDVKDPHLREWVIGIGADEDELVTITWDRWKYPHMKRAIWGIKPESDLVLIEGVKKGFQARRAIYVRKFWVIQPDD